MSTVLMLSVAVLTADYGQTNTQRREKREEAYARSMMNKWLDEMEAVELNYKHPGHYPDTAELIEKFVFNKTKRPYEVMELAFVLENHTAEQIYGRVFRAKIRGKDGKDHMIDFLLARMESAYLEVVAWQKAREATGTGE